MPEPSAKDFERVRTLLTERGVTSLDALMAEIELQGLSAVTALNTIRWWDDLPASNRGTGLLVTKLREGGVRGYKRAHQREKVEGDDIVSLDKQMTTLRGICLTPDGIDRETAELMYAKTAEKAGMSPQALVDEAMCPEWVETPPHPAKVYTYVGDPEGIIRYLIWTQRDLSDPLERDRPHPQLRQKENESDLAFSCRFWGWVDPPGFKERVRRFEKNCEAALAERRGESLQIAAQPLSVVSERQGEPTNASASAVAVAEPPSAEDERWGDVPWTDEDLGPREDEAPW